LRTDQITKTAPHVNNIAGVIGADKANSIAIKQADGGVVIKNTLDYKRHEDILVYRVDITNGQMEHKVEINAMTGAIIRYESNLFPNT